MIGFRLFLAQFRAFWRLRARLDDTNLRIRRVGFALRSRLGDEADTSSAIRHIVRLTLFDLLIAMMFSASVWWGNSHLFFLTPTFNEAAYVQLASGVAAIGGVFIGLYYAAMTAAMTAVYAQMPNSVSQLLMQERFGNAYMRFVATLTFTAVNLLALHAVGIPTNTVGPPVLALGSGIAVFGFVKLGTWAFRLFDPTAVSHAVFRELRGLFRQVAAGGYQWQSAAFQQYAQRRCAQGLRALTELADACQLSRYLREEPLVRLAVSTLHFAAYSITQKPRIPTKSLWFPPSYSQPDWYRSPDSQTSIAHHTGTLLQPQTVQNKWWVEKQCEDVAVSALQSLLERRNLVSARSLMSAFESYVEGLARHGWVTEALAITNRLEDVTVSAVMDVAVPDGERLIDRVAMLDYIGRLRITSVLRAADWADELDRKQLQTALDGVDWLQPTTPYALGLRGYSLGRAEWLAERLAFERLVSGRRVTPEWYCGELLAQEDAEALAQAITTLCRDVFTRMWAVIDRALERQKLWEAACLLSDALHYVRKVERHMERLQGAMTRISSDRRIKKLSWPEEDFERLASGLDEQYAKVVERMAVLIPRLPENPQDLPDYTGQFLHAATERVFECVIQRDVVALAKIFPGTFVGCLAKHDALRPADLKPDDPWLEGALSLSFAPILDVVELSGYSYLLSEIYPEQKTWPEIAKTWEAILDVDKELGKRMLAIIAFSKGQFAITPRSILRTSWHQRIERILRTLPTRPVGRGFGVRHEIDHPSAFVRTVVHPGPLSTMHDGADIFAAMYLLERPEVPCEAAHRQALELARWIAEEKDRANEPREEQ
jgi:hypothetical protein